MEGITLKSILGKKELAFGESTNLLTPLDKKDIELFEVFEEKIIGYKSWSMYAIYG